MEKIKIIFNLTPEDIKKFILFGDEHSVSVVNWLVERETRLLKELEYETKFHISMEVPINLISQELDIDEHSVRKTLALLFDTDILHKLDGDRYTLTDKIKTEKDMKGDIKDET